MSDHEDLADGQEELVERMERETERVGESLYSYAALPFEIASVLLLVAIVGSVLLARTSKQEAAGYDINRELLAEFAKTEPDLAAEGGLRPKGY